MLYSLNIVYTLLFISIYINIHYILILKQTLHINIKTNTLHYKLTYILYTLHINYTLDEYTLFILTIKHILLQSKHNLYTTFHYYIH